MTESALRLGGSLLLLLGVLWGVRACVKLLPLHPEIQRKIVHLSLGLYSLSFPFVFDDRTEVAVLCFLAIGLLLMVRHVPALRDSIGSSLYSVQRLSYGEFFFAVSIALVFYLAEGRTILFLLPFLILTLCDAAAAVTGVMYAKTHYRVAESTKSWEGSLIFFFMAWLLSLIALLFLTDIDRKEAVLVSLILAMLSALVEAVSWDGLDNIFVPITLFLLLERALNVSSAGLLTSGTALVALLAAGLAFSHLGKRPAHPILTAIIAVFFFWMVGGWTNVWAALVVLATHMHLSAKHKKQGDDLVAVLSLIGTSLAWYAVAIFISYNTLYVFNLALAIHMAFMLVLCSADSSPRRMLLAFFLSWLVSCIHYLTLPELMLQEISLRASCAFVVIALGTLLLSRCRGLFRENRWRKQSLCAIALSALGVPATL